MQNELKPNANPELIKVLEENTGSKLFDISLSDTFFDVSLNNGNQSKNKWNEIKLESFCIMNETINKMKKQPTEWENIFANDIIC